MKGYISIFRVRFNLFLQYRAAAVAGAFTQFYFGMVLIMIFQMFFESGTQSAPMTLSQTVSYIWLGQLMLAMLPWNGDREVQGMIKKGGIAYELVRPMNLYDYWFFKIMAQRIAPTLMRGVPITIIATLLVPKNYRLTGPASFGGFIAFWVLILGSLVLGCAISNIITIGTLFTIGDGLNRFLPAVVIFFSGMVIPIAFFPDWSQIVFRILPFSGLMDAPYRFYLGIYKLDQLWLMMLHQWVWIGIMVVVGRGMLGKARRRIVVQGG